MKNSITILIETRYGDLRASEKKAADYILKHMDKIRGMSLEKAAKKSGVSQPTIIRLTKALGFRGYKEFRYAIVEELAREQEGEERKLMYGYSLSRNDRLDDIPGKVVATTERIMEETLKNFSVNIYEKVIQTLKQARMIDIYSVENSNAVALDLLTKLLYLGFHCRPFDLHQPGTAFLRGCDFFPNIPDDGSGYDLYGTDCFRLRPICKAAG